MSLPPELPESPRKMLSSTSLGIRARRPRPELVDEGLGLGEGIDHGGQYARVDFGGIVKPSAR
jgi:hypothetical protein